MPKPNETQAAPTTGTTETPAAPAPAPAAVATTTATDEVTNRLRADVIITRHAAVAAGAGLIPIPLIDFSAILAAQVAMLYLLCDIWKQPFSKEAAKSVVLSAVGAGIPGLNTRNMFASSLLKAIPVIGTGAAMAATPVLAAATTMGLGKLFVEHLESGGTLLTFKASKIKDYAKHFVSDAERLVKAEPKTAPATA
jgi:uncharacterized protein (DUF697 family)